MWKLLTRNFSRCPASDDIFFFVERETSVFQLCTHFWRLAWDIKKLLTMRFYCRYSHGLHLYKNNVLTTKLIFVCLADKHFNRSTYLKRHNIATLRTWGGLCRNLFILKPYQGKLTSGESVLFCCWQQND